MNTILYLPNLVYSKNVAVWFCYYDSDNVSVGGDSAGGNIALVMSLLARDNLNVKMQPRATTQKRICISAQVSILSL